MAHGSLDHYRTRGTVSGTCEKVMQLYRNSQDLSPLLKRSLSCDFYYDILVLMYNVMKKLVVQIYVLHPQNSQKCYVKLLP